MRIAFVLTPRMLATSLTNAFELLFAAQQAASVHADSSAESIRLIKVANQAERVTLPSGLSVLPDAGLSKEVYDMVYLPALWRNPRAVIKQNRAIVDWVRWQYEHGAIINSTGTGVCFTAETGLLDGKPATTHWHHFDQFARDYPAVELKRQHFITQSERIFCAASINAQTDLTLHHVRRYFNPRVAEHLTRHFSHEVRQPFDKLSYLEQDNSNHPDETVLQAQLWMQNHLSKAALSMRKLAKLFGMSQRNFSRRFKQATDMTPVQYLQNRRLAAARDLLQNSNLSIKEIAYRVGYIDVSYFTKIFKQYTSVTPREYRTSVRAKLFDSRANP